MSVVIPGMNLEHERVEFRPRTVRCCLQSLAPSVALPAWYAEQGLCSSKLSIHLSVHLYISWSHMRSAFMLCGALHTQHVLPHGKTLLWVDQPTCCE